MFVILGEGELRVAEGPFIFRRSTPIFDICVATLNCLHLKNYVYSEHFILIIVRIRLRNTYQGHTTLI